MSHELTREQADVVANRGGGLLVSAAAGSGKTSVLVERLLTRVSEEGVDIDRFLVITYTKAAAAELRGRIAQELSKRLALHPTDSRLRRAQTLVYKAQISTVHAFCAGLLREWGHLLDINPDFRLCDEGEANILMSRALDEVLEKRYETITDGSDFALLVDTMSAGRDDGRLVEIVLDIRARVQSHPAPAAWLAEQAAAFNPVGITDAGATPWGSLLLEDARRQVKYWQSKLEDAWEICQCDEVLNANYGGGIATTLDELTQFLEGVDEGWDTAIRALPIGFPRAGTKKGCQCPDAAEQVKAIRTKCKKRMDKLADLLEDDSAGLLGDMAAVYPAVRALFSLVNDFEAAFAAEKERRGLLDFADLEHMAVKLLVDGEGHPTETAKTLSTRYEEIMVDEYQDTNEVQNAIFTALSREGRNLTMVGDVKQSIYRFRLADPTIFLGKYRTFQAHSEAQEGEERRIVLSRNFRSRGQVLEGANYLFENIMSTEFGEMAYTEREALHLGAAYPDGPWYAVELDGIDLSMGDTEGEEESEKIPKDLLEARFIAERISGLVEEGFPLAAGGDTTRPARYADIVILLRSPGSVLHQYARALGERDIPWEAEGGRDFFAATEVAVAYALLQIADNPRQDVPLLSVLRSPVYAFSADRLAQLRAQCPNTDFYTALTHGATKGETDCEEFLAELDTLRSCAVDRDSYQMLWHIYDSTNLLGVFGAMDEGETRQGNLLALCELARAFEAAGHKGLFPFITYLNRLRARGDKIAVPQPGREGGGVRIMSVHRSKGLEFPVVFLAGLMRQLNRDDMKRPILFHPKLGVGPKRLDTARMIEYTTLPRRAVARQLEYEMMAEELRLLYVAMTRAKEKLIMTCALTRGSADLAKLAEDARAPVEPQVLATCASVGQWVLLAAMARPDATALQVAAGQTVEPSGAAYGPDWDIRWIDGSVYRQETDEGTARQAKRRHGGEESLSQHLGWVYPYANQVEIPSKLTATQLKGRTLDEEVADRAPPPRKPPSIRRPRFADEALGLTPAQKGTALHLVMQYIDFSRTATVEAVQGEIARLVQQAFLTPQQGEAVEPEKIRAFFDSPLGREVLATQSLQREFKFSILVSAARYYSGAAPEEQVLLQGVVDGYFEREDGITVVDFKTDQMRADAVVARAEEYRPQLDAYAKALEEVTGKRVARRMLWFFSQNCAVEI